jgi:hypothetical protein
VTGRVEWFHVDSAQVQLVGPGEVVDHVGEENDGPALAMFTGSDGAVVEANDWTHLARWLMELALDAHTMARRTALLEIGQPAPMHSSLDPLAGQQ